MSTAQTEAARELLREIASDMKADMREASGKPLDGALLSALLGHQAAAIAALARAVESLLPQEEPERDPVPYVDYLPDLSVLDQPAVAYDSEDPHAPRGGEVR